MTEHTHQMTRWRRQRKVIHEIDTFTVTDAEPPRMVRHCKICQLLETKEHTAKESDPDGDEGNRLDERIGADMAAKELAITIKVAWWVMPYLHAVILFARLFRREPDMDHLGRMVERGLSVTR